MTQTFTAPRGVAPTPDQIVSIVPEPFSNSVVVMASASRLPQVQELITKLDGEASAGIKTESLVLKNAKAPDVANILRGITPPATPGKPGVNITADAASNMLLISGPADAGGQGRWRRPSCSGGQHAGRRLGRHGRHRPEERPVQLRRQRRGPDVRRPRG